VDVGAELGGGQDVLEGVVAVRQHRQELDEGDEGEEGEVEDAEGLDQHRLVVQRRDGDGDVEHVLQSVRCGIKVRRMSKISLTLINVICEVPFYFVCFPKMLHY